MILLGILPDTLTFAFWLHAKLITQFGTPSRSSRTRTPSGTKKIQRSR